MKTIRKGDQILRVKDKEADLKVKNGGYEFIPKSIWKEQVRKHKAKEEIVEGEKKTKRGKN
jgi:hypothetical protein